MRLNKDQNFQSISNYDGALDQMPFVTNVPFEPDFDWVEKPLIETKVLKPGDKVYIYRGGDGDCYGVRIIGVFSRKLNSDEIKKLKELGSEWGVDYVYDDYVEEMVLE